MVKFTLNDRDYEVEDGKTILEVALENGVKIPTLCYHKDLTSYGACRLCMVEIIDGARPGLQASCTYKVSDGLVVKTDTERVKKTRDIVFELLLARCPDSEKLTKLAEEYGITKSRIEWKDKGKCILCGLCVRACAEVSQRNAINFAFRGIERQVNTPFKRISQICIGCGACAYVCPTGAIEIEEAD
ncbi:(2Fe-2S)-binding protein [bacterium]|nr:(2Fe-2S)-binding protein [bacterium]